METAAGCKQHLVAGTISSCDTEVVTNLLLRPAPSRQCHTCFSSVKCQCLRFEQITGINLMRCSKMGMWCNGRSWCSPRASRICRQLGVTPAGLLGLLLQYLQRYESVSEPSQSEHRRSWAAAHKHAAAPGCERRSCTSIKLTRRSSPAFMILCLVSRSYAKLRTGECARFSASAY